MVDHKVRADEVKRRRKRRLMNQSELAAAAGMSLGQISRIEQGRHNPHLSNIKKIAAALEIDADEIIIWNDDLPDTPGETPENTRKLNAKRAEVDALADEERKHKQLGEKDSGGASRPESEDRA